MRSRSRRREANRRSIIDMLETTPATVAEPTAPSAIDERLGDLDFDWRPQPLERAVEGNRSFRWPIIGAALVLAALAIILVRGLGTFSDAQADERLATYHEAIGDFSAALDDLETALPDITVSDALTFSTATESLRTVAAADLPGLPPFVPQGALGEVERAQDRLLAMVDAAASISADLDVAATFSDAATTLFSIPPLPFSVPEELIGPAGQAITTMQSDTRATLAALEPNDTFATYVEKVQEALDGLSDWADLYLLALRRGDSATATELLDDLETTSALLDDELSIALTTISKGVDERLSDLHDAIVEAEVLTNRS
jgi:hypothetical protein